MNAKVLEDRKIVSVKIDLPESMVDFIKKELNESDIKGFAEGSVASDVARQRRKLEPDFDALICFNARDNVNLPATFRLTGLRFRPYNATFIEVTHRNDAPDKELFITLDDMKEYHRKLGQIIEKFSVLKDINSSDVLYLVKQKEHDP